jgi:hypothetical protein
MPWHGMARHGTAACEPEQHPHELVSTAQGDGTRCKGRKQSRVGRCNVGPRGTNHNTEYAEKVVPRAASRATWRSVVADRLGGGNPIGGSVVALPSLATARPICPVPPRSPLCADGLAGTRPPPLPPPLPAPLPPPPPPRRATDGCNAMMMADRLSVDPRLNANSINRHACAVDVAKAHPHRNLAF